MTTARARGVHARLMTNVNIHHLTKRFGQIAAVDDLSFEFGPGVVTAFLGPNGAGKTTTLRSLLGLVRPDSGTATFDGLAYEDLHRPTSVVGAVLESTGAHPARTGLGHLRACALAADVSRSRVDEVLHMVGLADAARRRVGGYSLGMRQRLSLATALLGDPQVLVLDEPTNGLDPAGVRWLRGVLRQLADDGRTVLVSSHLLTEVSSLVDNVVIVDRGRLVRASTLDDLVGSSGSSLEDIFLSLTEHQEVSS